VIKLVEDITPSYSSGISEEYEEIEIGDKLVRIHKPKDSLEELREQGKKIPDKSIEKIKKEIREELIS